MLKRQEGQTAPGVIAAGVLIAVLLVGGVFGCGSIKNWHRHQAVLDAKNRVRIAQIKAKNSVVLTDIELLRYKQQQKIERAKAQVRFIHSVGIRRSQDEIAKTLTPLYVAFEMTQALQQIATSGQNNSVIYVPTQPNTGLPIVPGLSPTPKGK